MYMYTILLDMKSYHVHLPVWLLCYYDLLSYDRNCNSSICECQILIKLVEITSQYTCINDII